MNILILSVGTRNKIIQYFKKNIHGHVIATDMSELAPAIYEADIFYKVPRITDEQYLDIICNICQKEHVNAVLSLIDPELSLLAKNDSKFRAMGTYVIGSSYSLCELCFNKWKMYNWLKAHGYNCAKTYICKEDFYNDLNHGRISFPVIVKPVCGSASISVSKAYDMKTIDILFSKYDDLIIQEFLNGQEIGADIYIDMISNEVVSIFTKKKLLMRSGETDKAVSFKDQKLFSLIEHFVREAGFSGQVDIDIFDINGNYFISEVNPRFGGGYPHAYECGCNHMALIANNISGLANEKNIGNYNDGVYMMKYNDIFIKAGI